MDQALFSLGTEIPLREAWWATAVVGQGGREVLLGMGLLTAGDPLFQHCGKCQRWLWLSEGALRLCGVPGSSKVTSEIAFPNIFPSLGRMALFPVFQAGTAWGSLFKLPGCCNPSRELTMLCQSLGSWEAAADQPFVIPRIKNCTWG